MSDPFPSRAADLGQPRAARERGGKGRPARAERPRREDGADPGAGEAGRAEPDRREPGREVPGTGEPGAADTGTPAATRRRRGAADRPVGDRPPTGAEAAAGPGDPSTGTGTVEPTRRRVGGRNLPAAIGVGLLLGGAVVAALFVRREAFVVLTAIACVVAIWEIANAFRARQVRIPLLPTALGAVGMIVSAYYAGSDALFVSLALTCVAILWWRVFEGPDPVRDVTAGIFTAVYVPYLAGFAILILAADDGAFRVMTFLIVAVASDVGGYLVGSLFGRHVLAPSVSPRKSWEGVGGSAALAATAGGLSVALLLGGPWWWGVVLGLAVTAAATVGDLGESLLKRDLGIKDMGSLLPGHGGVMDRMDSLLPAAPVAYVVLTVFLS